MRANRTRSPRTATLRATHALPRANAASAQKAFTVCLLGIASLAVSIGCGSSPFELLQPCNGVTGGSLRILNPLRLIAGQPGELQLAWSAGSDGMIPGDTLRIELPTAWHTKNSCPNLDNGTSYQANNPSTANYFGILDGDPSNRFSQSFVRRRRLDGQFNRFKSILQFRLTRGAVAPNEEIRLVFRGWKADGASFIPVAGGSGLIRSELRLGSR